MLNFNPLSIRFRTFRNHIHVLIVAVVISTFLHLRFGVGDMKTFVASVVVAFTVFVRGIEKSQYETSQRASRTYVRGRFRLSGLDEQQIDRFTQEALDLIEIGGWPLEMVIETLSQVALGDDHVDETYSRMLVTLIPRMKD